MTNTASESIQVTRAQRPSFRWHWQSTSIAGQDRMLAVASDPDGMLIEACRRQDNGEEGVIDPFWATTWRAASGLDRHLDRLALAGVDVLEVGCGTGHAGIAAAFRGANVTLTDGVEDPLQLVRLSLSRAGLTADVRRMRLGIDQIESSPGTPHRFPIILGSDVTYLRSLWPALLQTAENQLTSNGQMILSDPQRIISNEFREWLTNQPWQYDEQIVALEDDVEHPIRIMTLRRRHESPSK
ncbi:MAG: methyltransferase domain-containing protein [Planctomycetota bacterium]